MNRLRSIPLVLTAASAAVVALLSGCSNPPALVKPDPVVIEPHQTIDRVHNRDASVEFYSENRGGAAVRKDEAAHVLFNEHYEADAEALKAKRNAEMTAKVAAEAQARDEARKAADEAARKEEIKRILSSAVEAHKKDKSVYGRKEAQAIRANIRRDRSIYRNTGVKLEEVAKGEASPVPGVKDPVQSSKSTSAASPAVKQDLDRSGYAAKVPTVSTEKTGANGADGATGKTGAASAASSDSADSNKESVRTAAPSPVSKAETGAPVSKAE